MNNKLFIIFAALMCAACSGESVEQQAQRILAQSRAELQAGNYAAARDSIQSIRKNYPTALQTRAAAILLLDSIEMQAAADSAQYAEGEEFERLDMKARFFERKLQEDLQK